MTTRLYTHSISVEHITPPGHPERPDRIRALDKVFAEPEFNTLERVEAPLGDAALFELAHPKSHLKMIRDNIPESGIAVVDADTSASPKSWDAVLHVYGAAMDAVDAVFDSVSVATTFKDKLAKEGIIFCSFSEAIHLEPLLVGAATQRTLSWKLTRRRRKMRRPRSASVRRRKRRS